MTDRVIQLDNLLAGDDVVVDDITGSGYQYVKLSFGPEGTANRVESTTTNPLPVTTGTPGTAATDLAKAVDSASGATDTGIASLAIRDDALTTLTPVDGDFVHQRVNSVGAQWVAMNGEVSLAAGTNNIGDVDIASALPAGDNNIGNVDIASSVTLTVDLGANNDVQGDVAHDAVDSGNPNKMGARATNSIEGITQVANGDRTNLQADLNGVLLSRPHTTLEEIISERVSDTAATSTNFTNFAAGGAGVHNYVTTISIYNSSATDVYVDFRDGSAGSIIFTAAAPAAGGSVINLPVPLKGAANTALAYDVSAAASTVYISVVGFQAQG